MKTDRASRAEVEVREALNIDPISLSIRINALERHWRMHRAAILLSSSLAVMTATVFVLDRLLLRKMGLRSRREIAAEIHVLKALRGDFEAGV